LRWPFAELREAARDGGGRGVVHEREAVVKVLPEEPRRRRRVRRGGPRSGDVPASTRAHDLGTLALGLLESVGPATVRLSVYRGLARAVVWLDVATDDALEAVAEDRGLCERAIVVLASRELWYRRASGRWPTLWMVVRGPNHEGPHPHA
jgi:hypothetical protein